MNRQYKFSIDTSHLSYEIFSMYYDWQTIEVELSDDEVVRLLRARKAWFTGEEIKEKGNTVTDEEYFMKKYVPDIHSKVRKALEEQAPSIWGDKIIPELFNVDIFLGDELDHIYIECFIDWDGYEDVPKDKEEELIRFWLNKTFGDSYNNVPPKNQ